MNSSGNSLFWSYQAMSTSNSKLIALLLYFECPISEINFYIILILSFCSLNFDWKIKGNSCKFFKNLKNSTFVINFNIFYWLEIFSFYSGMWGNVWSSFIIVFNLFPTQSLLFEVMLHITILILYYFMRWYCVS